MLATRIETDFRAFFDAHFDFVWNALRRLGIRPDDLEDLAIETFTRVHERLADYDSTRPARAWLFGFAYRVAVGHRRLARHRTEVLGHADEAIEEGPAADDRIVLAQRRALLHEALESVPLDQRVVLLMHDLEELPIPAVAEALEIPVNTAYSRLRLARAELAEAVRRLAKRRGEP